MAQGGGRDSSYLAVARSLIAERGFRGLYQGFTAGLLNNSVTLVSRVSVPCFDRVPACCVARQLLNDLLPLSNVPFRSHNRR